MSPNNEAAWILSEKCKPLQVAAAPYTIPGRGEMVVKNRAVAINPVDWQKQVLGNILLGYIKYPFILGGDVAGTVVEVGPGIERFKIGDRVVAAALAIAEVSNRPAEGGFQHYSVIRQYMAAPLPDNISEEQACVIPLTLCTAAYGLFHPDFLALEPPTVPSRPTNVEGARPRAVIITGGSSSVGANAIQLAVAAGYEVLSTASPKNHVFVKKLGVTHVFDYHSNTLVKDMLAALNGRSLAGAFAIGDGAVEVCTAVLRSHPETTQKFIAMAGGSPLGNQLSTTYFTGVAVKFIDLKDAADPNGVVANVFVNFLPVALAARQFVPAPNPQVIGKGLDKIQEAMDIQMAGVSATKIVVSL